MSNVLFNRPIFNTRRNRDPRLRLRANIRRFLASQRETLNIFVSNNLSVETIANELTLFTDAVLSGDRYTLRVGDRYYNISQEFLINMQISANFFGLTDLQQPQSSDEEALYELYQAGSFSITKRNNNINQRVQGSFFKYLNNTDMNLECLAIFKEIKKENYELNCLLYALKEGGLNETKLNRLKTICQQQSIPRTKLTDICNFINIKIALKTVKENGEDQMVKYFPSKNYKNNKNQEFKLCCYDNHYFINKRLPYRKYYINKLIKGELKKNINEYKDNKTIKSYDLVKLLLKHKDKLLKPMTYDFNLLKTVHFDKITEIKNLTFEDDNFKDTYEEYLKKGSSNKNYHKVFFDFETYRDVDDINKPYLCCYIDENNKRQTFLGEDCGRKLLDKIPDNSLLIAHNANFDINFIINYLYELSIIKKGNKMISVKAKYNKKNILIKDSYLLISMPLRKFGKCFNLEQHKEVMVYKLYDKYFQERNKNKYVPLEDAYKELNNKEDEKLFYENCEKWNLLSVNKKKFDIVQYSAIYCLIDCKVLMDGYQRFREWILDLDFDIDGILTLASLADQYFIKNKCYNEVYKMSGVAREFIQKTVVGGRCMTAKNKSYKIKNCKMADFDAVSLYPSAMKRLQTELGGFLKGKPKVLTNLTYDFLKHCDGYFVEIKLKEIKIYRDFPLISYMNDGVRLFTNEAIGKILFVDRIQLEDLIRYHDIEFEIIRGYYYNEGRNKQIGESIEYIFNKRLELKKQKNPAQMVYKLLMNSAYGKTILKPITEDVVSMITDSKGLAKDKVDKYIMKNYNQVKYYEKINNDHYTIVKNKSILEHYSRPHIGTEILSMSKRIMHEVMATAEDHEIKIFYTDTDSLHLLYDDVFKLEKIFNKKYNRLLIGKQLGQFHVDFSLDGVPKENEETIYAKNCIFLGKKTYIDQLVGLDKNNKEISGYHIRAKGIPNSCILYECNKRNINPFELYELLFNGEKITFDLLENGDKINLKIENFVVKNNTEFTRSMHFV